jgi:hypothetical protein
MSKNRPWEISTSKTFVDYNFTLDKFGNIWQDEELEIDSVHAELGDCFVLSKEHGRLVFIKLKRPYSIVPYPPRPEE